MITLPLRTIKIFMGAGAGVVKPSDSYVLAEEEGFMVIPCWGRGWVAWLLPAWGEG